MILAIVIFQFYMKIGASFAAEPKTPEEAIQLLIEQQNKWFPKYTCEFEVSSSVVPNGREALTRETFPKSMKMKASKKKDDYVLKSIEEITDSVPGHRGNYVRTKNACFFFTNKLGIAGYARVSGVSGIPRRMEGIPQPDRYYTAFSNEYHCDPEEYLKWLKNNNAVASLQKVQLEWPAVQQAIHLRLIADSLELDIFMDPAQGYLPVKVSTKLKLGADAYGPFDPSNPRLAITTVLLESKEFSNGRFFPTKVMTLGLIDRASDESGRCLVMLHKTIKLEVDKDPSEEDLSIPVPAGCLIGTDSGTEGPYIKFRRPENVKPSDLPQIISMLEKERDSLEKTGRSAIQDTALIPPKPKWSRYLWWGVAALALLTLLNLVFYLLRKRTKEKTS
ncbi:MAG: hypothetical protein N2112_15390 [Gemmataceae bacterium]|nr:hypothetical protein [Gemmataceae bacterium]